MADDARLIAVVEANTKQIEAAMKRLVPIIKGSTDQMTASVRKLDSSFVGLGNRMSSVGRNFVGGFLSAVSVSAIQQMIKATVAWGDALGDLADQTGISVKQIQILRYAAKQTGSSAEQMDATLKKFGVTLGIARTKGNDLKKILDANGISLVDMAGKARSNEDVLKDVIDLIGRMGDEQKKSALNAAAFGKGNDEVITTFRNGFGAIQKWGAELEKTGLVSKETVDRLGELDQKINQTGTVITTVFANIVGDVEPLLSGLLSEIQEFARLVEDAFTTMGLVVHGELQKAFDLALYGRDAATVKQAIALEATHNAVLEKQAQLHREIQRLKEQEANPALLGAGMEQRETKANINQYQTELAQLVALQNALKTAPHPYDTIPGPMRTTTKPAVMPNLGDDGGGRGGKTFSGEVRQLQASVAATRKLALSRELESILEAASKKSGLIVEVVSGGQAKIGTGGPRKGSTRHDLGGAADLFLRDPATGKRLDPNNPADLARIQTFIAASAGAGATGIGMGPGYMRPGEMHVGMGAPAIWGRKGGQPFPWLAGTVAAGRANPMFVEGREQARLSEAEEQSQELADNFEKAQQKAMEAAEATLKINDALTNANQAFKRDLVGGFVRDLERGVKPAEAIANALMKIGDMLLDRALNAIFPDVASGVAGAFMAGGGVMTSRGPMPLRKYAGGGVAHSPQLAMFGEGHGAEAFVPLPDGRRIPVNIRVPGMGGLAGGRGGQAVAVHNRVTVEPSPLFITTTTAVARQGGRDAVVEAGDHSRRRPGGR